VFPPLGIYRPFIHQHFHNIKNFNPIQSNENQNSNNGMMGGTKKLCETTIRSKSSSVMSVNDEDVTIELPDWTRRGSKRSGGDGKEGSERFTSGQGSETIREVTSQTLGICQKSKSSHSRQMKLFNFCCLPSLERVLLGS
jgi:hypothetical protein